ncbi:protein phosphatase 2C domain-containing protein [Emticicia sp. C21]|uniref:protein phosphatase 2C domain-containing protein n=1 Tax=Emticicia sp. C21 TaxID=2302915 RepID=UPI000E3475C2|nr:protein phosphatase 2C domain-containing protein [Emticicia sp. C21]RFS17851.1 stage II sporulation protein E (SpoIIE) [Emticicia sp. C21]
MKIYTALQKGEHHPIYCEDYYFVGKIGDDMVVCAVMDGCTMATDSYFASTLVGKLLRKITKEKSYKAFYGLDSYTTPESYLKAILADLFNELSFIRNQLMLETAELLTTLVIMLVDKKEKQGIVMAIGDGLVCINGQITDFDQNNVPDYVGYHLHKDFEEWYSAQQQKILFHEIQDIIVATDGIFTFMPINKTNYASAIDPMNFLLFDKANKQNSEMLSWQLKHLEFEYGLKPTDDLAMIRILL